MVRCESKGGEIVTYQLFRNLVTQSEQLQTIDNLVA
jgi:hypothetical protein